MNFKTISISLSPNTEKDDVFLALKLFLNPFKKKPFSAVFEDRFSRYLPINHCHSFNSGRSALMAILDSLGIEGGSGIFVQAFTCNAAINPILWSGFKPIYVDCNQKTFNIDINDLKNKINHYPNQKALIVQHTFGFPADIDQIIKICQENNLILIEDCAHALGAEYFGKKVGTFGKAAFFSFSRDKVISSVYGGMAVTNDKELSQRIKKYQKKIGLPSFFWTKQQLLHPILMNWLILPSYNFFGKYLLVLFQSLRLLSKAVHFKEKRGLKPKYFPKALPNSLAVLALNQFEKLERFNRHRKNIYHFYLNQLAGLDFELPPDETKNNNKKSIFLRLPLRHKNAHDIIKKAWKINFLIGDWYTQVIAPGDTKLNKMDYLLGSCPKAEELAKTVFNLPTHINISQKEAGKIIDFIKDYNNENSRDKK